VLLQDLGQHDDQFDLAPQDPARDIGDHDREVVLDLAGARLVLREACPAGW
jgi:hypothetical protein